MGDAEQSESHAEGVAQQPHLAAGRVGPVDRHFLDPHAGGLEGGEDFDIEAEAHLAQPRRDVAQRGGGEKLHAALRIVHARRYGESNEECEEAPAPMPQRAALDAPAEHPHARSEDRRGRRDDAREGEETDHFAHGHRAVRIDEADPVAIDRQLPARAHRAAFATIFIEAERRQQTRVGWPQRLREIAEITRFVRPRAIIDDEHVAGEPRRVESGQQLVQIRRQSRALVESGDYEEAAHGSGCG